METTNTILIVGCGPGDEAYLTKAACDAAVGADLLVGAERLFNLIPEASAERFPLDCNSIDAALNRIEAVRCDRRVAVLVSGDPGCFSLSARVIQRFGRSACEIIPGISAVQLACARLAVPWEEARVLSAHGRTIEGDAACLDAPVLIVLGGGENSLSSLRHVWSHLSATHDGWFLRDLSLPAERVEPLSSELTDADLAARRVLLLFVRKDLA